MAIPEFFAGQTIFITGGTGFVGKVLLEKLLRSCPDLKRIYLAIRVKKGATIEERWKKISSIELFDTLKKTNPEALEKVFLMNSDIKKPNLGLSDSDCKILINEVNVVYHAAATVQFVENIVDTFTQNTKGTYFLAELCKLMTQLKVLVHVSTTYCNFCRPESEWDEKIYPAVQDWKVLMKLLDTEAINLQMLQEKLMCGHPNPYTFSKSLAEIIIRDYNKNFLTVIVRPSAVISTTEEPMKGWVDSLNGMAALCIANSLGILRIARSNEEAHQDYIPVDAVAKALVIAPWITHKNNVLGETPVYNCTIGKLTTIKTSDISKYCDEFGFVEEWPSKYIVWTRDLKLIENPYKYYVLFYLYQLLPACILDAGIYLYGEKPIFLSIAKKLANTNQRLFKDFCFGKVHFPNDEYLKLQDILEESDLEDFAIPAYKCSEAEKKSLVVEALKNSYLGILRYYLKEDLSKESIEKNKKRYMRIKALSMATSITHYIVLTWLMYKLIGYIPAIEL